jgi:SAM-dependent methyltransferase
VPDEPDAFREPAEIRDAYRDATVAKQYVGTRFLEPLGALLHDRQIAAVRRVIAEHGPKRILELAPGPARLTAEVAPSVNGSLTAVDASLEMLREARRRMRHATPAVRAQLVQGDAFKLPFAGGFDLVFSFRLIRHFNDSDRRSLYAELHRVIRPGGILVFDAVNEAVSAPLRRRHPGEYKHYDALLTEPALRAEVAAAGFAPQAVDGVQHRFPMLSAVQVLVAPRSRWLARAAMEAIDATGGQPLEWIVTCRRE